MSRGRKKKTDDEFFAESLEFYITKGNELSKTMPQVVDLYNDHSLLKLLSIHYWVGIFAPIAHNQLGKYGYKVAYIDTMAGSGVTQTNREGDHFVGSFPGAMLAAARRGYPFDLAIGVELQRERFSALDERTKGLVPETEAMLKCNDIAMVSGEIVTQLPKKTIAYTVIDPQALQGLTWEGISPLLCVKGDAMLIWFEMEVWRLRQAALSEKSHAATESNIARLDELFMGDKWRNAQSPTELTDMFVQQVIEHCGKQVSSMVKIPRPGGNYYQPILFTGQFKNAEKVANEWASNVSRRINSLQGKSIDKLLDVRSGRSRSLLEFIEDE